MQKRRLCDFTNPLTDTRFCKGHSDEVPAVRKYWVLGNVKNMKETRDKGIFMSGKERCKFCSLASLRLLCFTGTGNSSGKICADQCFWDNIFKETCMSKIEFESYYLMFH